ncbi:hypothetical protein WV31_12670 [Magnetospirillum sp. ME-1]|nr:hypothetical protein WV31_12670 [Magnetospirillum sp. ME-1]
MPVELPLMYLLISSNSLRLGRRLTTSGSLRSDQSTERMAGWHHSPIGSEPPSLDFSTFYQGFREKASQLASEFAYLKLTQQPRSN